MTFELRKEIVTPSWADSRDTGKKYLITEWPAMRAEKFWMRVVVALKGTSAQIPEQVVGLGMVGLAIQGLNSFLQADVNPDVIEKLMDEMMECVKIIRDHAHPENPTPLVGNTDIMDVKTILWLRSEVLRIHTNFSLKDGLFELLDLVNQARDSLSTPTFPPQ